MCCFDYFGYFYEPIQYDRDFTLHARVQRAVVSSRCSSPTVPAKGLNKKLNNCPRDFVFVNRIQWGRALDPGALERAREFSSPHPSASTCSRTRRRRSWAGSTPNFAPAATVRSRSKATAVVGRVGPGRADAACAARS